MTLEQLRAAYPGCPEAVLLHETPEAEELWEIARASDFRPDEIVALLCQRADRSLARPDSRPGNALEIVRHQMNHPDFVRYVAAKLGAM